MREALDRQDQAGDPRRGFLDLRGEAADRAAGGGPAQRGVERGPLDGAGEPIERLDRHGGFGERFGGGRVEAVVGEPVGDGLLALGVLDRRPHALLGRGRARAAHARRSRRTGRRSGRAAPSARAACSTSSSRLPRSAALRSIADAGLFSSWARPADSRPSETIFSSCSSLDVKSRARSSIRWTRIDVSSGHSRISARKCSRGTTSTSAGSWATDSPGRADRGGSTEAAPPTSPSRHSDELVRTGAAIDEDRDAAREQDEQALDGRALRREHVADVPAAGWSRARPATRAPRGARRRGSCASPVDRRDRSRSWECHQGRILHPSTSCAPRLLRGARLTPLGYFGQTIAPHANSLSRAPLVPGREGVA